MVLDWPRRWRENFKASAINKLDLLNKSDEHKDYYTNTIDFVHYSEHNSNWYEQFQKTKQD